MKFWGTRLEFGDGHIDDFVSQKKAPRSDCVIWRGISARPRFGQHNIIIYNAVSKVMIIMLG